MREDIKLRREKYEITTDAQKIFAKHSILTSRPIGMSIEDYRIMQKLQNKIINELFRSKPDQRVSALMRPSVPSLHLQRQVALARLKKIEKAEELEPKEKASISLMGGLFNYFRKITGGKSYVSERKR